MWDTHDADVYDDSDGLGLALFIMRSALPDIYADAVERIRSGASEKALDRFICGEISRRGIPLDNLELLGYGIPLTASIFNFRLFTSNLTLGNKQQRIDIGTTYFCFLAEMLAHYRVLLCVVDNPVSQQVHHLCNDPSFRLKPQESL